MENLCLYDMPLSQLHHRLKETGEVICPKCGKWITSKRDLHVDNFGQLRDVCPRSNGFSDMTVDSIMETVETGKMVKIPSCQIMQCLQLLKTSFFSDGDTRIYVIQSHPYYGAEYKSSDYFNRRYTEAEFRLRVGEIIKLFNLFRGEENDNI